MPEPAEPEAAVQLWVQEEAFGRPQPVQCGRTLLPKGQKLQLTGSLMLTAPTHSLNHLAGPLGLHFVVLLLGHVVYQEAEAHQQ